MQSGWFVIITSWLGLTCYLHSKVGARRKENESTQVYKCVTNGHKIDEPTGTYEENDELNSKVMYHPFTR